MVQNTQESILNLSGAARRHKRKWVSREGTNWNWRDIDDDDDDFDDGL